MSKFMKIESSARKLHAEEINEFSNLREITNKTNKQRFEIVDATFLPRVIWTAGANKHVLHEFKSEAPVRHYVGLNNPGKGLISVMIFDVDAGNALLAWSDNFSFQPAWFAGTDRLVNGQQILDRPHIVIKLSIPVNRKNKRAMGLFNAVYNEIRNRLIADGCTVDAGQKPVTKNPDSGFWDVRSRDRRCWTLHELAEALGLHADDREEKLTTTQFSASPAESRMGLSRNCDAFESNCQSRQEMLDFVGLEVTTHNATLPRPMKIADVKSITKSIGNWTWEFYTGSGKAAKSRGRMVDCIDQDDSLTLRKQKGAYYSASVNAAATYQKCVLAYTEIAARGEIPTQSQVVKLSGVSRSSPSVPISVRQLIG
jgi:hypothetical protein